ncbi:MAG: 1-acyl-sn-glycerol-3-phosphate acyltransferase [Treponemataceae bacterium]|nr:1-acyl-sn-glycerol-3-phosphate acyltransferase [Treponemataceae bacterium]
MTTIGAVARIFWYLVVRQKKNRYCKKLEKEGKIQERDEIIKKVVPEWARFIIDTVGCRKCNVTVEGVENLPADSSVVFIGNHQSYLDIPLILGYSGKPTGFIAKAEILKVPMLSDWMKHMECTFLKRNSPRQSVEAMAEAVKTVQKGYSLVIFPEGHRSKSSEMKEFHPGSFKLAFRSEVPIIPVTIDGTYHLYEEKRRPSGGDIKIIFHKPVPTKGLDKEGQAAVIQQTYETIKAGLPA